MRPSQTRSRRFGNEIVHANQVHCLNDSISTERLTRCKELLKTFGTGDLDRMLFTDERLFTVEEATNSKTIKKQPERAPLLIINDLIPSYL